MRFLILFTFLVTNVFANDVSEIKNIDGETVLKKVVKF